MSDLGFYRDLHDTLKRFKTLKWKRTGFNEIQTFYAEDQVYILRIGHGTPNEHYRIVTAKSEDEAVKKGLLIAYRPTRNVVRLSAALKEIQELADGITSDEDEGNRMEILNLSAAALAAPPRNCDVSKDTAEERYLTKFGRPWTTQEDELAAWLFAPADKGGGNG